MPLPNSRGAYRDIEAILDTILRYGQFPVDLAFPEPRHAIDWNRRANKLRMILRREEEQRLGLAKGTGSSLYDMLVFRNPQRGKRVVIDQRPVAPVITIPGIGEVKCEADADVNEDEFGTDADDMELDLD